MTCEMVGGPLDGMTMPNDDGYFEEGEIVAVDSRHVKSGEWSRESIYRVTGGRLIYDAAATEQRRFLVAVGEDVAA